MEEVRGTSSRTFIWPGIHAEVGENIRVLAQSARQAFIFTDRKCIPIAKRVALSLIQAKFDVAGYAMYPGESRKNLRTALGVYNKMAKTKIDRGAVFVTVGGGVVTELGGFVASTYREGLKLFHVPTSLVAQLDVGIAGKTGLNIPDGKNFVATTYSPAGVFIDPSLIETLPKKEYQAGLAEAVKYGMVREAELLAFLEENLDGLEARTPLLLEEIVYRCASIKAAVEQEVDAVPRLLAVMANAIEVRFQDRGNDPAHLERALPAGSIARLVGGVAEVKGVSQPFASFGGDPRERDEAFRTRVSERLRHKDRCVTPWDYERIVLQGFPQVHRVKCIPHARPDAWASPGDVLLVVVPDLRRRNGVDRLRPRVEADTISRIRALVQARAGMQVRVHVSNPRYQPVRLRFAVRFAPGRDVNQSLRELQDDLIRLLSPWVADGAREITFGGALYRSALLYQVERLAYVDYVRDFQLLTLGDGPAPVAQAEVRPARPDAIFVSDAAHDITPIP